LGWWVRKGERERENTGGFFPNERRALGVSKVQDGEVRSIGYGMEGRVGEFEFALDVRHVGI
jgi:hypothetical protein